MGNFYVKRPGVYVDEDVLNADDELRIGKDGTVYPNLNERLRADEGKIDALDGEVHSYINMLNNIGTPDFTKLINIPTTVDGYGITDAIKASQIGIANGIVPTDADNKIPLNYFPSEMRQEAYVVTDSTERDSITGMTAGNICFETSTKDTYIYDGTNWVLLADADWANVAPTWASIVGKPTTLAGFGITDAVSSTVPTVIGDVNLYKTTGSYYVPANTLNAPTTNAHMLNVIGNGVYVCQIAINLLTNTIYSRFSTNNGASYLGGWYPQMNLITHLTSIPSSTTTTALTPQSLYALGYIDSNYSVYAVSNVDLDIYLSNTYYRYFNGTLTNAPSGVSGVGVYVIQLRVDGSNLIQHLLTNEPTPRYFIRTKTAGTWGAWIKINDLSKLGDLTLLKTNAKNDLTSAINEVVTLVGDLTSYSDYDASLTSIIAILNKIKEGIPAPAKPISTATIVVSASDSKNKANADFACTGTNDDVTVQNAISALPATGGKVVLLDGTYNVGSKITVPSNVTIEGQGNSTILKIQPNSSTLTAVFGISAVSDITFKNFKIDGNKANNTGTSQKGFTLPTLTNSKILNVTVTNLSAEGIYMYNASNNNLINGCTINGCAKGIALLGTPTTALTGNIITDNNIQACTGHGIYAQYIDKNIISSNVSSKHTNSGSGIYLQYSNYNDITSNQTTSNSQYGITIANGTGTTANYNTINSNTVQGNTLEGIYVNGISGAVIFGTALNGNVVQGNYIGISVGYADKSAISGNITNGNSGHGIAIVSSYYVNVSTNTSHLNRNHGIYLNSSTHCSVTTNNVAENSQATHNSYDGICLDLSSTNMIQGNTIRQGIQTNKQRWGINIISSACTGNMVVLNDLTASGVTAPLNDGGTGTYTTGGNKTV